MTGPGPTVIKLGGSILDDAAARAGALSAIANAWNEGEPLILVHGGGRKIDAMLVALGLEKRTHKGLRITDEPTLEVVVSALAGVVNKMLVSELAARGVTAAGISGADGGTLAADVHPSIDNISLGRVGRVTSSNPSLIHAIASKGILPVVGSVALGRGGQLLNVNADSAAAAIAVATGARQLVFLTDVPGLLDDRGHLVPTITADSARMLVEQAIVKGGMLPKLQSAVDAVSGGVGKVLIAGPQYHAAALSGGIGGTHLVAA